jgi:hypothetical protein
MEIREISDSVVIYSDGKRLQVIHDLGDEFILDLNTVAEDAFNLEGQVVEVINTIEPVFKVSGFCSKIGEGMHRLRWAIMQFDEFERYIKANQADLLDWWENPGGKYD